MVDLNRQKAALKNHGLMVDGKLYKFKFTGDG